jgi:hypothetical protein
MSLTVLEILENAHFNFTTLGTTEARRNPIYQIAMVQLKSAITAIEDGTRPLKNQDDNTDHDDTEH